jgi:peroxiredoxin
MGLRGQRFALIVEDGTATHVAVEAPGQFEVSKAETILANL